MSCRHLRSTTNCNANEPMIAIINIQNISPFDIAIGPKGTFVNISRGSVVDEPALIEALQSGKLGTAGLDVFVDEPRVPEAFMSMENVVLQPHVASATHQTRKAMGQLVIDNLAAHFAGKPLVTPI